MEEFTIETSLPSTRMDVYLKERYPEQSRETIKRLIGEGHILRNGQSLKPTDHPRTGDVITIDWPLPKTLDLQPQEIPLDILFEDKDILVINKAPGICVHPAAGHDDNTIVNAILHHCHGELSGIGGVARPGIVHRLDQFTSGALIITKNDTAHIALSEQFANRTIQKFYLAIVCGNTIPAQGRIDLPIKRGTDRKKMTVGKTPTDGRNALTTYRTLARSEYAAIVEAQIHTGRTHQVRVHLKHIGYPLVGDDIYGHRQNVTLKKQTKGLTAERQMLHAWKISFTHPTSGKQINLTSNPPRDWMDCAAALGLSLPQ